MFMLRVNALAGQPARDGLGPACAPYSGRGPLPMLSCTLNHVDILRWRVQRLCGTCGRQWDAALGQPLSPAPGLPTSCSDIC